MGDFDSGPHHVRINLYDISSSNQYTTHCGVGIFHTGVELFNKEFAYGGHPHDSTGIFATRRYGAPGEGKAEHSPRRLLRALCSPRPAARPCSNPPLPTVCDSCSQVPANHRNRTHAVHEEGGGPHPPSVRDEVHGSKVPLGRCLSRQLGKTVPSYSSPARNVRLTL
mmetsp:Transcript_832/g.3165  ORF Transcript_832/g.3165 Transcript_832/m.3165 type:complete len:167 (+) Transcript_832:959-1459(+)